MALGSVVCAFNADCMLPIGKATQKLDPLKADLVL